MTYSESHRFRIPTQIFITGRAAAHLRLGKRDLCHRVHSHHKSLLSDREKGFNTKGRGGGTASQGVIKWKFRCLLPQRLCELRSRERLSTGSEGGRPVWLSQGVVRPQWKQASNLSLLLPTAALQWLSSGRPVTPHSCVPKPREIH